MLTFENLNYLAIIIAWFITVAIGGFWYSPAGFGKLWSKLSGVNMMKTPKDEANRAIAFVAASSLVQVFLLAVMLKSLNVANIGEGIIAATVIWFGFTALTTVGNTLYQRLGWKFWWLNASYFLIVFIIDGIILAALK